MTTFSPDDPSIWHYRRKEGEELPPELVAARRESLRKRRPQPEPVTVSETRPAHPPVSTPYLPRPETPVEQYVYEYREYLRTRPDWREGQVSPYVIEPRNPSPEVDRSVFGDNRWIYDSQESGIRLENTRDEVFGSLLRAVKDNDAAGAAYHLGRCGPSRIHNMRFEHDPMSNRDYLTLELRVPANSMVLRGRLFGRVGRPGPMLSQHFPSEPPRQLRSERDHPMLRVQVDWQEQDPSYLEHVHFMQERMMNSVVIPPGFVTRLEP